MFKKALPIFCAIFIVASCDNQENGNNHSDSEFPGFQSIVMDGKVTDYLFDKNSVQLVSNNVRYFKLIEKLKDGYVIQSATTNCKDQIVTEDGIFHPNNNAVPQEHRGSVASNSVLTVKDKPQLKGLIENVCNDTDKQDYNISTQGIAIEDVASLPQNAKDFPNTRDLIVDDVRIKEESKLENAAINKTPEIKIISRPKQAGFLLSNTNAQTGINGDYDTILLNNGSQVEVTGISGDDKWQQIRHNGRVLYVPTNNVAVFSD